MTASPANIVEIAGVTKRFPGVLALDRISVGFRAGEVHAVIGENGAGKSTLMNILAGDLRPDGGRLLVDGKEVAAKEMSLFYPVRGGGVVGRYAVRQLLEGQAQPPRRDMEVRQVVFDRERPAR